MFYPRKISPKLERHLAQKQATIITGMRRTGKTTLVRHLLDSIPTQNKLYLDLERIDLRELFSEKNYETIVHALEQRGVDFQKKAYIALDEIHLARNIPSIIKYFYDHYNVKFIATGSSSFYIKHLFTESLAGRKKIFELFPLDFGEFLIFKNISYSPAHWDRTRFDSTEFERVKTAYEEYIRYGGFPEVVLAKRRNEKIDLLQDIVSSYITIDIKSLADFRDEQHIYALLKMLASRTGNRLDYSKLARLIGLSPVTVRNYVDFFEKTYLLTRVPVFSRNIDREIVKAQKIYMNDNGILAILADVGSGARFENAIFTQLRHQGQLRYYALKTGREIDFIVNGRIAIEVKETPTQSDQKTLQQLSRLANVSRSLVIGRFASPRWENYIWGGSIR